MRTSLMILMLAGCSGRGGWSVDPHPPLELVVDAPAYGAFLADRPIEVRGRVTDPTATVWVEGREVNVGTDGTFRVFLPVGGPYRVVDVEAANPERHLRERRPVFAGEDPLQAWPGALTLRVPPSGLDAIAKDLGPLIDDLVGGFFSNPAQVALRPGDDGLKLLVRLGEAVFSFEVAGFQVTLGIEEVVLGATVLPEVNDDGMLALSLTDSTLVIGDPILQAGGLDPLVLEQWLGNLLGSASGFLEGLIDGLIAGLGSIPLGGPVAFETDLLGTRLALSVDRLWTDPEGIGGSLGMALGDAPAPAVEIPAPRASVGYGRADLALGLHEGLFQLLLTSELLALLEQDLELGGIFANILALTVTSLPGGHAAPAADAWCVKVTPGTARAARLQGGTAPLARLYLPDLQFKLGYSDPLVSCKDWLVASLELEVDVALREGTRLDIGLHVADGAVLSYGTPAMWDEQEVVAGLGGLLENLVDLMGGQLELDLGELFGGLGGDGTGGSLPLGDLQPRVIASEPILGEEGPIDGLFAVSLKLWD